MKRLFLLPLLLVACKTGGPITGSEVYHCGSTAVQEHAHELFPAVNTCLTMNNYSDCLWSLVQPAASITIDVVSCLVRAAGSDANGAALANPADAQSAKSAERARDFLAHQAGKYVD